MSLEWIRCSHHHMPHTQKIQETKWYLARNTQLHPLGRWFQQDTKCTQLRLEGNMSRENIFGNHVYHLMKMILHCMEYMTKMMSLGHIQKHNQ